MDEKKDFLASESEAENTANSDADTTNNENIEETFSGAFSDELAETQGAAPVDYSANVPVAVKEKKRFIQVPIIISIALIVLVALGFLVFRIFFNTSIDGTWMVKDTATADEATTATSDEAVKNYYCFEDDGSGKGGKASIYLGSMRMIGEYTLSTSEEGTKTVTISIPTALEGTYEYEVSGNEIFGRTLELKDSYYGQKIELESTKLELPEMKPDDDFKPNEKLTGKWTYDDGFYKMSYEFREDGTATVSQSDILFADGVYSYTDSSITIKYYTNKEVTMELNYELKDNSIIIDGIMQFVKETDSTSDES